MGWQVGFRSKHDKDIPLNEGEDAESAWKMFSLRQVTLPQPLPYSPEQRI